MSVGTATALPLSVEYTATSGMIRPNGVSNDTPTVPPAGHDSASRARSAIPEAAGESMTKRYDFVSQLTVSAPG
jgi:hypothetical protein